MPEVSGAIPVVELAPLLWALPLLPLAGALFAAWLARSEGEQSAGAGYAAPVATWLSLLSSLLLSYRLANLAQGAKALVAPGPVAGRVGSIELHLGLAFDATSALGAVLLLLIASAVQLGFVASPARGLRGAWAAACTAAGLLSLLSSNLLAASVGAGAMVLLGAMAAGGARRPGAALPIAPLLGDVLIFSGGAAVLWGLSGSWLSGDLVLSERPAFVAVVRGAERPRMTPVGAAPSGFLTVMTGPATRVFVDNDSKPIAEAPFVKAPLPAGPHSFSIDQGPGVDRFEVRKVRVPENSEVVLVKTAGAAEATGAAALLSLRSDGKPVLRQGQLASDRWGGVPVGTWAGALLALGLLLRLAPIQATPAPSLPLSLLIPQAGGLLVAGAMGLRWLPLLGAAAGYPAWIAHALLLGASLLSLLGLSQRQPGRALGLGAAAGAAAGLAAAAAGSPEAGALLVAINAVALALALWALALLDRGPETPWELASYQGSAASAEGTVRWLKIAYAALIGLAPLGFALLESLRALDSTGRALLALSTLCASASLGRAVYLLCEGEGPPWQPPRNMRRDGDDGDSDAAASLPTQVAPAMAALLALLGPLGAATVYAAPLASWLASSPSPRSLASPASVWMFLTWFGLSALGLLGARWARVRYGEGREAGWAEGDERSPLGLPSRLATLLASALLGLATAVARLGGVASSLLGTEEKPS